MNKLPPLPNPYMNSDETEDGLFHYTSDQMIAYAAAAVAADREAICRLVYGQCGSDNDAQRIVDAIRALK